MKNTFTRIRTGEEQREIREDKKDKYERQARVKGRLKEEHSMPTSHMDMGS